MNNLIAWQGEVEVLNATWSLDQGRMVEFRLCGEAFNRVHPFKIYQQRRGGRVGTRFTAAFARITSGEHLNTFDLMLASWKDGSTNGQSVVFWIDDEPDMHPFAGCERRKNGTPGDMFALVLVELQDDDTPINQAHREAFHGSEDPVRGDPAVHDGRDAPPSQLPDGGPHAGHGNHPPGGGERPRTASPAPRARSTKPRKLSSSVHLLVSGPFFLRYLIETKSTLTKEWTREKARTYAKSLIAVESLSVLDRDPEAVKRYHELIRKPFDRWNRQEP